MASYGIAADTLNFVSFPAETRQLVPGGLGFVKTKLVSFPSVLLQISSSLSPTHDCRYNFFLLFSVLFCLQKFVSFEETNHEK